MNRIADREDSEPSTLFWERLTCKDCGAENWRRVVAVFGGFTREVIWCQCGTELHPHDGPDEVRA